MVATMIAASDPDNYGDISVARSSRASGRFSVRSRSTT